MQEVVLLFKTAANVSLATGAIARTENKPVFIQATIVGEDVFGELFLENSADNLSFTAMENTRKEVMDAGSYSWDGIETAAKYVRVRWNSTGGDGDGEISVKANV